MKKYFLTLLIVMLTFPVFAVYTIRGKIVDSDSKAPLDYVNVALIKGESPAPAAGVVSDDKGNFLLPNVPKGKYILRISFVGYNTLNIPLIVTDKEMNMGEITLIEDSKALSEIQVLGQGTQMRFDIDKKVFSVDQNIASAGGSATEVLQNIPSVDVDNEGNVSLRNSGNVEVWINGKPSGLTADNRAQILQQMPAESIESIEVMTNPSAKFNPEGTAGIINIVLKKNRKAGYYGSVSAGSMYTQGATKPGATLGANINYSSSKIDANLNIGYRSMGFVGGSETNRYNLSGSDTLSILNQNSSSNRSFGGVFLRGGIDYHIADNHTFSLSGFGMNGTMQSNSVTKNNMIDFASGNSTRYYQRNVIADGSRKSMSLSLDYKWDIDKKGSNLMSSLSYSGHNMGGSNIISQINPLSSSSSQLLNITQSTNGQNRELLYKLDYTKKFSDISRIEAGWQTTSSVRNSPSSAIANLTNKEIYAYFNEFNYREQIHAAYLTYGTRFFNKLSVQGGLRAEYLLRSADNTMKNAAGEKTTSPIELTPSFRVFPSMYISYSLPENNELQLNYTSRINRPRGREINPFRDYSDSTNISYGNPTLTPEYANALEFNYLKSWDAHSISASAYYRFTDQLVEDVQFINAGTMESTYMNLARSTSSGIEIVAKNRIFKIVNLTSSLNLYYNKLDSSVYVNPYNSAITTIIPEQENFTWSGRIMANIILGKTTFAQISGEYSAPQLIAQGRQTSSYSIDLGLRQTFFNKNLSLNFMVRDLLNSRKRNTVTWGQGFYQTNESYFHGRMIGLTATWNFGNTKPKPTQDKKQNQNNDMNMENVME